MTQKPTARDLAKLGVCHPGQSYNPTEDDHDDVLASAVAVELRRQEAVDDEKRPVAVGMSKQTLDLLIGDSEVCGGVCPILSYAGATLLSCVGKILFVMYFYPTCTMLKFTRQ